MATLEELSQHFNIEELEKQLEVVIESQDPVGYMQSNINWEIDIGLDNDDDDELAPLTKLLGTQLLVNKGYEAWNPLKKFLNWLKRNRTAKTIKKILCSIADELKKLIDEEAELKKILGVAISAIIAAIGIGAINPMVLTLIVGLLATMILKGVANVCAV